MESLVMFDYEGAWGMPHQAAYDIEASTNAILEVLSRHGVHAMFFVVGRLLEEHPQIVEQVHAKGHAIGIHGYRHEHLDVLSPHSLGALGEDLRAACQLATKVTGIAPTAFRAPYLLAPRFVDEGVTRLLLDLGFTWTSNRELRFPEEVVRPDRALLPAVTRLLDHIGALDVGRPAGMGVFLALNAPMVLRDPELRSGLSGLQWLRGPREPIVRPGGLLDVAVASPLDCDLLGTPRPDDVSPDRLLQFATRFLGDATRHGGSPYTVSFHDWIIGTSNRLTVLEGTLEALSTTGTFVDARHWAPRSRRATAGGLTGAA